MALLIDAGRLVDTTTGQRWWPDEITDTGGLDAATLALRSAGDSYHRITRGEALIFARHSALGVRLRDADIARERVSDTLAVIQGELTEETLDGMVFRPPASPELLDWLLARLDAAEALANRVGAEAKPIFRKAGCDWARA